MAAEANLSLLRQHAAVILARQAAHRIIVRKIRAQGRVPLSTLSHAVLTRLAMETRRSLSADGRGGPPTGGGTGPATAPC
jgi:hypothetical protein